MRLIDKIYGFVLFTQFSETYRLLLLAINKESIFISTAVLIFNLFYIFSNITLISQFFKNKLFIIWFALLFFFPLIGLNLSVVFGYSSGSDFVYWTSFNLLFVSLFCSASIFAYKVNVEILIRIAFLCIISTIIGFVLNYTYFELFRKMGMLTNSDQAYVVYGGSLERGISFFSQPNRAAFSIVCYFVLLMALSSYKAFTYLLLIILFISMVFVTGSRTSLILCFILVTFFFSRGFVKEINKRYHYKTRSLVNLIIILVGIAIPILLSILVFISGLLRQNNFNVLGNRLDFLNILSSNSFEDKSLNARTGILTTYWTYIKQNSLFGYGTAWVRKRVANSFDNVSQNAYLEYSIYYGIPFCLYYIYTLCYTFSYRYKLLFKKYHFNVLQAFTLFIFLLGFSVSNLYWNRALIITIGLIIGLAIKEAKTLLKLKI